MNHWWNFGAMLLVQVTVISSVALLLMACFRRSATTRHAIGLIALVAIGWSPWTAAWVPEPRWIPGVFTEPEVTAISSRRNPAAGRIERDSNHVPLALSVFTEPKASRSTNSPWNDTTQPIEQKYSEQSRSQQQKGSPISDRELPSRALDRQKVSSILLVGIATVWLIGVAYLVFRHVRGQLWVRSIQKNARQVSWNREHVLRISDVFDSTQNVARWWGGSRRESRGWIESIPIFESSLAPMPMVCGTFRQSIVLPQGLADGDSDPQVQQVLIHELAHIYRMDALVCWLQRLIAILWWPHPLVHWMNREISEAREEICDNFVLQKSNPIVYAETLLAFAERFRRIGLGRVELGLYSRPRTLEQRVVGLLSENRGCATRINSARWLFLVALFMVTVLLAGGTNTGGYASLLGYVSSSQDNDEKPVIAIPAKVVKQRLSIQGECIDQVGNPIEDVQVHLVRVPDSSTEKLEYLKHLRTSRDGGFQFEEVESFIEKSSSDGFLDLAIVCKLDGYSSVVQRLLTSDDLQSMEVVMSTNIASLTGTVVGPSGNPVAGATVYIPSSLSRSVDGVCSAITDEEGRFSIDDVKEFQGVANTTMSFYVEHPDFGTGRGGYQRIPQVVQVTLPPAAFIEGKVIDRVTGSLVAGATVCFQGIGGYEWITTRTDEKGKYRAKVGLDYFNAWSEMEGRIAVAAKAIEVEPGKTTSADIELVQGGWVKGKIIDSSTGEPWKNLEEGMMQVAHHGPARPMTGAAVTSTIVHPDGSFRLHVAPGRNYVYMMNGGASVFVEVKDGQEVEQNLETGRSVSSEVLQNEPDRITGIQIQSAFRKSGGMPKIKKPREAQSVTKVEKLIEKLEMELSQFADPSDKWLRPMYELVELGEEAVPELIEELDAAEDDKMIRSLAFVMRGIGDRRAIPSLIRCIPRTLVPPGSDYGLTASDPKLVKFAQEHDLHPKAAGREFDYGRPVREVFGALQKLSGEKFSEEQLYSIFLDGTDQQKQLKRVAYQKTAEQWRDWWESNAERFVADSSFHRVQLKELEKGDPAKAMNVEARLKTGSGGSNWILESAHDEQSKLVFMDLDTAKTSSLPGRWKAEEVDQNLEEILQWAAAEGYDLMGSEHLTQSGAGSCYCLRPIGLQLWELPEDRWKMTSEDTSLTELQAEGRPTEELFHFDVANDEYVPTATGSFLYITKEGAPGLLFLGIEVTDDSLQPGGAVAGDNELNPVAFNKGRRLGFTYLELK